MADSLPPVRRRRTQAERSARTRAVLVDATVRLLHTHGYGATTIMLITAEAGVSRGAMLHQFPTKADLMAFVVEAVYAEEVDRYRELLSGIRDPEEMLLAYPEALWNVLSRPSGIAVLEIIQGSRSDPDLAEKILPVHAMIQQDSLKNVSRSVNADPNSLVALTWLVVWAIRGLSIVKNTEFGAQPIHEAVNLLRELLKAGLTTGLLSVGSKRTLVPEANARSGAD